jgi:ABC-type nitrate/sulfonate/bicarbonate transport system substrate-binding protein
LHAPLSKAIESVNSRAEQVEAAQRGRIETELKEEQQRYIEEVNAQTEALKQEHPDYLDVVSKNVDKWLTWVEDQPKAIRDAVARNADDITDAAAASKVLSAFKAYLNPPATAPQPSPQSDKRQRQIGATASPGTSNRQPVVTGIPEDGDPQAIWDALEKEDARKQR